MEGSFWGRSERWMLRAAIEILLYAGELDVALVVAGVFKSDGGLQGEAFNEVGFVDGKLAAAGRGDDELGQALAVAVVERPWKHGLPLAAEGSSP